MSSIVAQYKKCTKCKNYYDANSGIGLMMCPYCLKNQMKPNSNKKSSHWPKFFI